MDAVADFLSQVYDKAGDQLEIPKEHSLQWHLHVATFGVVKGTKSFGPDYQHLPSLRFTATGDRSITAVPMESLMKVFQKKEHKEKLFNEIEDWALHTVDDEAFAALFAAGLVWHLSVTPSRSSTSLPTCAFGRKHIPTPKASASLACARIPRA